MYRNTDLPDNTLVQISLTIRQVKIIDRLVENDLVEIEQFTGENIFKETELQQLMDVFFPILKIKETREENIARLKGIWSQEEIDRAIEIGAL
ncbi:MAG: hypothetical protein ACXW1P_00985 [Methylophilaceae bacterium]